MDWEEAPKHFLKPNFQQKRSWLLFGGLLTVWSTITFWILVKPFHLRCMLSKLIRYNKSHNACSQHWSAEMTHFFSVTMPYHMSHNQSWTNWATELCLICYIHLTSHQPTTFLQASWQLFAEKTLHNQQEAENAFQGFTESWRMNLFYATGINQLISHLQNCVDFNSSYFD